MKASIESEFGYCPLLWMFCGRKTNARINHIHDRALNVVYNDESPFEELLGRYKSETIYRRNIKILVAKLFKIKYGLSTILWYHGDIMTNLICKRSSVVCSLRLETDFSLLQVKSVNYGLKAWQYFGPKISNIFPSDIKNSRTLQEFSKKFKSRIPQKCPCRNCEDYIYRVGFTNNQYSWRKCRIFNAYIA